MTNRELAEKIAASLFGPQYGDLGPKELKGFISPDIGYVIHTRKDAADLIERHLNESRQPPGKTVRAF